MTKKDYEVIAKSLNDSLITAWHVTPDRYGAVLAVIEDMADTLAAGNPRFRRDVFIAAATK
jgi:hypothetical protein